MDWDAIGAIGEILGATAVLVTLIYLARQVRQNTDQQKREELISIQNGQNALLAQLQDPRVLGALVRTAEDQLPTIEDRGTGIAWLVQYLNHFQIVEALHRNGSLAMDEEQYQLWAGWAVAWVAPKGIRRWWYEEDGRLGFHSTVRDLIDAGLEDTTNPPIPVTEMYSHLNGTSWKRIAG